MRYFFVAVGILLSHCIVAQIDSVKLDSLQKIIASKTRGVQEYQDSFLKEQERKREEAADNETVVPDLIQAPETGEAKSPASRTTGLLVGVAAGIALGTVLMILYRRHKSKRN
jgi:hypothetical protein